MMNLYDPMLFVGIGGTGLSIGRELEAWLREAVCGPTGRDFTERTAMKQYQPFQLPKFLQFVYIDLDKDDLTRVMSGPPHELENRHHAAAMDPGLSSYREVAAFLRAGSSSMSKWLPAPDGEPQVAPLQIGAGQLPMAGRAALFASMARNGASSIQYPIKAALRNIETSGAALQAMGGQPGRKTTVFVAFSVCGGTGCGTFYDILYLLADAFRNEARPDTASNFEIYPLVLMPSAFDSAMKPRELRKAKLNSAPALLDLYRFIDYQNGRNPTGDEFVLSYPDAVSERLIKVGHSAVQTAVLFSGPNAMSLQDVRRSMVAFMMSMMSVQGVQQAGQTQSFASTFINGATERQAPSGSGLGCQSVSTALTASLRAPVDRVADLVAGRLLTSSIEDWEGSTMEDNSSAVREFLVGAGLSELESRTPSSIPEVDRSVKRASEITDALSAQASAMESQLDQFEKRMRLRMASIAAFDFRAGLRQLSNDYDIFRISRIIHGVEGARDERTARGVSGWLNKWAQVPATPATRAPLPSLKDRAKGLIPLGWNSSEVSAAEADLAAWYQMRQDHIVAQLWANFSPTWQNNLQQLQSLVNRVVGAFVDHKRTEPTEYTKSCADLLLPRQGVTYHLPVAGPGQTFDQFVAMVTNRYCDTTGRGAPNARVATDGMIGTTGWRDGIQEAFSAGFEGEACYRHIKNTVTQNVKEVFFASSGPLGEPPVWPSLASLLFQLAQPDVDQQDSSYSQLAQELTGVLPVGVVPRGSGPLRVLVTYPGGKNANVEDLLRRHLVLPESDPAGLRFEGTASDSLEVTMFRDQMGVAEHSEISELVSFWLEAQTKSDQEDYLPWRRRFPSHAGRTMAFDDDVERLLHQLLNVLWDGDLQCVGGVESPTAIRFTPRDRQFSESLTLELTRYGDSSSWHSFIAAYEAAALKADDTRRELLRAFSSHVPLDAMTGAGRGPSEDYRRFVEIVTTEQGNAATTLDSLPTESKAYGQFVASFWGHYLEAAVKRPFSTTQNFRHNHLQLARWKQIEWPMTTES